MATPRKKATRKAPKTFQDNLKRCVEAEREMYDEAKIARHFVVTFPNRQKPPLLGRLAVKLLGMSRGVIQIQYTELK